MYLVFRSAILNFLKYCKVFWRLAYVLMKTIKVYFYTVCDLNFSLMCISLCINFLCFNYIFLSILEEIYHFFLYSLERFSNFLLIILVMSEGVFLLRCGQHTMKNTQLLNIQFGEIWYLITTFSNKILMFQFLQKISCVPF